MMGDILPFEPRVQTAVGLAFCISCKHEWQAVAPTGTKTLECPACECHMGKWKFEFMPPEGSLVRECDCGNDLFRITPEGHQCAKCGVYQRYA